MPSFFQIRSFFNYWLDSVELHSLHSPFFYDFYTKVIRENNSQEFQGLEDLRTRLLKDDRKITVDDRGAGGRDNPQRIRRIGDIARTSLSSEKFCRLYARMVSHFNCKTIIELGTSIGISTLYLAADRQSKVTTFEGASGIAAIARQNFAAAGAQNIRLIEGDIIRTLALNMTHRTDFAFMDANHRYDPTISYFKLLRPSLHANSVVVIDDIHYSDEMNRAWTELKADPLVFASADLFRSGVLFFDPSLNKQHVVLQV